MYGRAKTWTCQSLAKMFAKNRCRVASFSLRWLRLSKRFSKKSQNRCTLRLEFICKWKIGTKMTHMQILLNMSTRRTLCFILQVLNYVCIYMVQLDLTSFSSVQTQGRCPPFFPFHIVLAGGSRPGAPHHRRHHPKSPGGGPAPPSSGRARSAPRCESPADLHEQPGDPSGKAGEAGWGGAEVFGWREVTFLEEVFQGHIFCVAKAWGLNFFFSISRYYWVTFFERTNTN